MPRFAILIAAPTTFKTTADMSNPLASGAFRQHYAVRRALAFPDRVALCRSALVEANQFPSADGSRAGLTVGHPACPARGAAGMADSTPAAGESRRDGTLTMRRLVAVNAMTLDGNLGTARAALEILMAQDATLEALYRREFLRAASLRFWRSLG